MNTFNNSNNSHLHNTIPTLMTFTPSKPMESNEIRDDVVAYFITLGKDCFSQHKNEPSPRIEKYNVLHWLFVDSQSLNIPISIMELNQIVDTVYAYVKNVPIYGDCFLEVGNLKKSLEGLAYNTPVLYQRIEDKYFGAGGWKTIPFQWDNLHKVDNAKLQWLRDNPSPDYDIVEKNGLFYRRDLSHYIPAFSAHKAVNDNGETVFIINSHY